MAPTIQTGHLNEREKRSGRNTEKKSDLACRIKYCNTLPDIPFDPKFITYPFESNRFVQYNPTSLERNYKHDLLTEHDLGVPIDLINVDTYAISENASLGTLDEKLLEEEIATIQDSKRSRHHAKSVSWLRRTEYISTEYTRFQPSSDKTETKVGYNVKRFFKEEDLYMDRNSQIKAIDNTFSDSKKTIEKHHTKPNVTPLETLSLFPDFEMWRYPCAQVIFDSDPASIGRPLPAQLDEMSQAMIRGVMDESGEQFVAYFLPTDDTLRKRKRDASDGVEYQDDEEYEYTMAREYNWNVKNKASKGYEENYFFVFRNEGVYYNELETRVRLNKRRLRPGAQPNNSRLVVHHRPLNELEFKTQEVRMMQLEPQQEEEEIPQQQDEDGERDDEQDPYMETESETKINENDDAQKVENDNDGDKEIKYLNQSEEDEEEKDTEMHNERDPYDSGEEVVVDKANQSIRTVQVNGNGVDDVGGPNRPLESSSSSSSSSSSDSSNNSDAESGNSSSSSNSDHEVDVEKKKRDEAEIFGSDSD